MEGLSQDELYLLAIQLDTYDILRLCETSSVLNEKICQKDNIWYNKLNLDFPDWKDHPEIKGNSNKETYVLLYKLTKLKQKLRLKQNIYELYTLEKLNIFSNITELPKEIGALTNLKQLNLVSSNITRLPKEIGMLTNLTCDLCSSVKNDKIFVLVKTSMLGKDIYREILLKLDDEDLMKACGSNRYFHETVCNDDFFHARLLQKYPDTLNNKPENMKYKAWFLRVKFWISELKYLEYEYVGGDPKIQMELLQTFEGSREFLIESVERGQLPLIKYSVSRGWDIHFYNDLLFLLACQYGYLEIVTYLAKQGSNIHVCEDDALILACKHGHLKVVKYLVERGAKNKYALGYARDFNHLEVVNYLESLL